MSGTREDPTSAVHFGSPACAAESSTGPIRRGSALGIVVGVVLSLSCGDSPTGTAPPPPPPPPTPVATTVNVTPGTAELSAVGATVQLSADVRDQAGRAMPGAAVSWASGDESVATVEASGVVTAVANGTAAITATAGSASGTATVTVMQSADSVVVSPPSATLAPGDTVRLSAEALDANGHPVAGAEFSWSSSDESVAMVDGSGLVTGVAAGEAEIAGATVGVTGRAAVSVEAPAPAAVSVTPDTVSFMALGDTARLSAEVHDQFGRPMPGEVVSWASGDASVATVDSSGLVTAAGAGATTVTATADSVSASAAVTVMQSAGSVAVTPPAATLALGDTVRLSAEALDANGHPVAGAEFSWSSSDESVATVDGSGLVTGVGEGNAMVTAAAGNARGNSEIIVTNPDRAALVALYEATDGANWVNNDGWLTDAPLGEWYGVETDGSGRVVELSVGNNNLSGPIPHELGDLSGLTTLYLVHNDLAGAIPPELGDLGSLASLNLQGNNLTGPIPTEIGNLANLTTLWLPANGLSGPIPAELGNLSSLRELGFHSNNLTGPIPPELGKLGRLQVLFLRKNNLSGPIPFSFLQLRLINFFIEENADLCVPRNSAFDAWLRGLPNYGAAGTPSCDAVDRAALESLYEVAGGPGWIESDGWLGDGYLDEWYGVTGDSLGRVTELDLTRNGLVGSLPQALGSLAAMTVLQVGGNGLSGRLPASLARVPLREFHYADTDLCVPSAVAFQAWLNAIPSHEGTGTECAPLADRDILEIFYAATSGPNWASNDNWLTDAPLSEWYGVRGDGHDRVVRLNLFANDLSGEIPPELGDLSSLEFLDLTQNALTGPLPPEIGNLSSLGYLRLDRNGLTGPVPPELGDLSSLAILDLQRNRLTGPVPPEIGDLGSLTHLVLWGNDLSGEIPPELGNLTNLTWIGLSGNNLSGPIPPELGNLASLRILSLWDNDLSGEIPPELGGLTNLTRLDLALNSLAGPVPPELGNLANVTTFSLLGNALTGPIPPELGNLDSLRIFSLRDNDLSGEIPSELGDLAAVRTLALSDNEFSGPIPPALGGLSSVEDLNLAGNALTGPLPPELGDISTLEALRLQSNDLSGAFPAGLGGMSSLKVLELTNNPRMEGALPADLTALSRLDALLAGDTGLCAPADLGFQAWLRRIYKRRIAACAEGEPPAAYLVQAVQSREFPVPLVAGERALLRVFPTAGRSTSVEIPPVRARFHLDDQEVHVVDIAGKSEPVPTEVNEGSLATSANAEIPGDVVRPGLEMVVEIDPDGTLDPSLGVARRIPRAGRMTVDVREVPIFDLTLVPFVWTQTGDSSIVDLVGEMAADPYGHEMFGNMHLLPIDEMSVTAHDPVLSSSNNAHTLLHETVAIRAIEGGTGHYMAMMSRPVTGAGGVARRPGRSSFSQPFASTIAHELGHNLSLQHAPCGSAAGPDLSFPNRDGSVGAWGYDFREGGGLVRPSAPDLMSYCNPRWISDYHFTNALNFRLSEADSVGLPDRAPGAKALLLWGGIGADSVPFLEPAFVVNAPPALPDSAGDYRVTGHSGRGTELFSLSFDMPEVADGDGSSSFAFALPVRPGWERDLVTITLTGPGGSVVLDGASDRPMAILRDPRTGQVRGFLRDLPPTTLTRADAAAAVSPEPGLEVLFSRGIPAAEAWH